MKQSAQFVWWLAAAWLAAWRRPRPLRRVPDLAPEESVEPGISVVIPSRDGRALLAAQLPGLMRDLAPPAETIVVDNGSSDGTAEWLSAEWPAVEVDISAAPLSFAAAVNRGIARARYSHVCLLNNDMLLEPGFFAALARAFRRVPGLFCATAQIRFPAGVRREETGKAVMARAHRDDFPVRCDEPVGGEDLTWVLYGSGGCSLYDVRMLRALGGMDEAYAPAYVEDLDIGYRAWQCEWPTVYVAGAVVEHRHRATTARFYSEERLAEILEINYLKFLARAVADGRLFRRLWSEAIGRLYRRRDASLRHAVEIARAGRGPALGPYSEQRILALGAGEIAVFPGLDESRPPLVIESEALDAPTRAQLAGCNEAIVVRKGNALAMMAAKEWTEKRRNEKRAGGKRWGEFRLPQGA